MSGKISMVFQELHSEWVVIDETSGPETARRLLREMAFYNGITTDFSDVTKEVLDDLISEMENDNIVASGGLVFSKDKDVIYPGCCCGLEECELIVSELKNGKSPWMGHDPYVNLIVENDVFTITQKSDKNVCQDFSWGEIKYDRTEFLELLDKAEVEFHNFIDGPLSSVVYEISENEVSRFRKAFYQNFLR